LSLVGPAAALYALFVWWFSTGLILYAVGMPRFTHRWIFGFSTLVMLASLFGLSAVGDDLGQGAAYHAFTCTILVWAWVEIAFLLGIVTGPRREPLSPGASGAARFGEALAAILHHELMLIAAGLAVLAASWGGLNQVGTWTFAILWLMRLSAKLNLFLGVPNRAEEFLPDRVAYLASYFAHRPMNALFPLSITGATIAIALLVRLALDPSTTAELATGLALVIALLALATLEHWLLVLPLPAVVLWRWGLESRRLAGLPDIGESAARGRAGGAPPAHNPAKPHLVVLPAAGPLPEPIVSSHRRGP